MGRAITRCGACEPKRSCVRLEALVTSEGWLAVVAVIAGLAGVVLGARLNANASRAQRWEAERFTAYSRLRAADHALMQAHGRLYAAMTRERREAQRAAARELARVIGDVLLLSPPDDVRTAIRDLEDATAERTAAWAAWHALTPHPRRRLDVDRSAEAAEALVRLRSAKAVHDTSVGGLEAAIRRDLGIREPSPLPPPGDGDLDESLEDGSEPSAS